MFNATRVCAVPACDRPVTKREWCEGHYTRWRKTGDPGITPLRPQREHHYERGTCSVAACSQPEHCKGLCGSHYLRMVKTGTSGDTPIGASFVSTDFPDGTRTCNTCGFRRVLAEFHKGSRCKLGRRSTCKDCVRSRNKARRAVAPEVYAATSALRRARKTLATIDPNVTHQALRDRDGDKCHYCEVTMSFEQGNREVWNPIKASLEHLVPLSRGGDHSFENTVLACLQCNVRKHDKTPSEWQALTPC